MLSHVDAPCHRVPILWRPNPASSLNAMPSGLRAIYDTKWNQLLCTLQLKNAVDERNMSPIQMIGVSGSLHPLARNIGVPQKKDHLEKTPFTLEHWSPLCASISFEYQVHYTLSLGILEPLRRKIILGQHPLSHTKANNDYSIHHHHRLQQHQAKILLHIQHLLANFRLQNTHLIYW